MESLRTEQPTRQSDLGEYRDDNYPFFSEKFEKSAHDVRYNGQCILTLHTLTFFAFNTFEITVRYLSFRSIKNWWAWRMSDLSALDGVNGNCLDCSFSFSWYQGSKMLKWKWYKINDVLAVGIGKNSTKDIWAQRLKLVEKFMRFTRKQTATKNQPKQACGQKQPM